MGCGKIESVVVLQTLDGRLVRAAQRCRQRDKRIEYGLQIKGRPADDLEHVGSRGLLLQRFSQLVEQASILDGDDGLIGEIAHQFDLLVGEWANLLAVDDDGADQRALFEHRHDDSRSSAREPGRSPLNLLCGLVDGVDHLLRMHHAAEGAAVRGDEWAPLPIEIGERGRRTHQSRSVKPAIAITVQHAEFRLTQPRRVREQGLEYELKVAGRAADHLQNLRGRSLLLQRLGESLPGLSEFAGPDFELRFQLGGQ